MYYPPEQGLSYEVEGDHIKVLGGLKQGKITGTMMGGILGLSPFTTPFCVACELLGLGSEDIHDKPAVKRGKALEGKIIRYADGMWPSYGEWVDADTIFGNRGDNPHAAPSDFEDELFAGHLDGIIVPDSRDRTIEEYAADGYIIEVKTSVNYDSWAEGVPEYYLLQAALYDRFFAKKGVVYFLLGLATPVTDRDPYSWIANEETVYKFDVEIDEAYLDEKLEAAKEWYDKYIRNGITPDYDHNNQKDVDMYNHLIAVASTPQQKIDAVDRIQQLTDEINALKVANHILEKESELKDLKDQVKDAMSSLELAELSSSDGQFHVTLSKSTSYKFEEEKLVAQGIDPRKYQHETVSYTLRTAPIKKK